MTIIKIYYFLLSFNDTNISEFSIVSIFDVSFAYDLERHITEYKL